MGIKSKINPKKIEQALRSFIVLGVVSSVIHNKIFGGLREEPILKVIINDVSDFLGGIMDSLKRD